MDHIIQNKNEVTSYYYFDRDISWLSFNERVMMEAANVNVPPLEQLNFLSIFSSNLDEFYRVRMPALAALHSLYGKEKIQQDNSAAAPDVVGQANTIIQTQQHHFGQIFRSIIDKLSERRIYLLFDQPIPAEITKQATQYFSSNVLGFLKFTKIDSNQKTFFPENNKLYIAITGINKRLYEEIWVVNIPSDELPRFFMVNVNHARYIVFLDDLIKENLNWVMGVKVKDSYSFKVTRNAELKLGDIYQADIAERIEQELAKRDSGLATRMLHEPGLPPATLKNLVRACNLENSIIIAGGRYHNLKDLRSLNISNRGLKYDKWPSVLHPTVTDNFLLDTIGSKDLLIHTPYQSYDPILRFFNEAAVIRDVEHIYITLYRVAADSRILNALLSALANGKRVTVLIELKARFDEENNLKWAKRLKSAGAEVIYTSNDLKVHAKVSLVIRKIDSRRFYVGLLATGNLNEGTARFYTDHVLLTGNQEILNEIKILFKSFRKEKGKIKSWKIKFRHLLVAKYNLQSEILSRIENEISNARNNHPARIVIKLNNLEEQKLIDKLYDASNAGVKIDLIVRSICRLVPGVKGMSENISVRRIVDRYLEHGRVLIFYNKGRHDIFLGSADWMDRNIYRRIEVCFPLYDELLKKQMLEIIELQLKDDVKAVQLDEKLRNRTIASGSVSIQSQHSIYEKLAADAA